MLNESKFQEFQNRQQESGLNVKDFCSNEGIPESTFYYWRKKLQKSSPSKGFIPLVVKEQTPVSRRIAKDHQTEQNQQQPPLDDFLLEMVYPNGTRLRMKNNMDLSQLRALIHLYH